MAHQEEPMDVDSSMCDFDNKENAYQHGNVLPRSPSREKGSEELDVSELSMKLRYSTTPAASPMSKSYTANVDNRTYIDNDSQNPNNNMTRSLQSTLTNDENRPKALPLQALADPCSESTRSILHPLDSTVMINNVKVTVSTLNNNEDIMSYPSSSSSSVHTPEATTPTKEITKDAGSPIIGVFKSVLNMFRSSQSPIPPEEENTLKSEVLSPPIVCSPNISDNNQAVSVSTPLAARMSVDMLTKRTSPIKENIVFKEELQNELQWSDESTIIFDDEKVPIHKLLFPNVKSAPTLRPNPEAMAPINVMDNTVEYMDISYNDSAIQKTMNITQDKLDKCETNVESDSEFVDCETTFNKNDSSFSAETSLEYVDYNLDSTKDIVDKLTVLSDDTVNDSTNTLEASTKSDDLSNVSVETTLDKTNNSTPEVVKKEYRSIVKGPAEKLTEEVDPEEKFTAKIGILTEEEFLADAKQILEDAAVKPAHVSFSLDTNSDSPVISHPDRNFKTPAKQKSIVESISDAVAKLEASIDLGPPLDNDNVINSIAQIPLMVDPRILIFNIPSEVSVDKIEIHNLNFESPPADVPLPDDDELAFLPPISNNVVGDNVSLINRVEGNEKVSHLPLKESEIAETKQGIESIVNSKLDNVNNETAKHFKQPETNDLTNALQVITQTGIAPIVNNLIPTEKEITEQIRKDETAMSAFKQNKTNDIASAPEKNDANDLTNVPVAAKQTEVLTDEDVMKDQEVTDVKTVKCDITSKPEKIVVNENASTIEAESKPLIIDIPQSPKPENFVAPVSDLVIKGCVQETPSDCIISQSPSEFPKQNVQDYIIKTIPASLITKLKKSLGNRETEEKKFNAAVIDLPVSATSVQKVQNSDELILSKDNNLIEIKKVQNENEVINKSNMLIEPVMEICAHSHDNILPTSSVIDVSDANKSILDPLVTEKSEPVMKIDTNDNITSISSGADASADIQEIEQKQLQLIISSADQDEEIMSNEISNVVAKQTDVTDTAIEIVTQEISNDLKHSDITVAVLSSGKTDETFVEPSMTVKVPEKNTTNAEEQLLVPESSASSDKKEVIDEEIVASESNSPFVSLTAETESQTTQILEKSVKLEDDPIENLKEVESTFAEDHPKQVEVKDTEENSVHIEIVEEYENTSISKSRLLTTPPSSPAIVSKGYNFNFDEIEDPFATKTKIRQSPPPGASPNQTFSHLDDTLPVTESPKIDVIQRPLPQKRKPIRGNKKLSSVPAASPAIVKNKKFDDSSDAKKDEDLKLSKDELLNLNKGLPITKNAEKEIVPTNNELMKGLPEIDDLDLNPFATKNKMRASPPPIQDVTVNSVTKSPTQTVICKESVKGLPEIENPDFIPFTTKTKIQKSSPSSLDVTVHNVTSSPARTIFCEDSNKELMKGAPENVLDINPFATKTKIRVSPPPSMDVTVKNVTRSPTEIALCEDFLTLNIDSERHLSPIAGDTKENEKDSLDESNQESNVTCLSKTSTMQGVSSVNTEDEDTIEGPFLDDLDLKDDKMSDFDSENVGMFELGDLPPGNEDNAEGEMFIDAEAFEFLLNQNKTSVVADSGKESLFLKFDPLFAKRMSGVGISAASKRQGTPKKTLMPPRKKSTFVATPKQDATFITTVQQDLTFLKNSPQNSTLIEAPSQDITMDVTMQQDSTFVATSPVAGPSKLNLTDDMDVNATLEESFADLNVIVAKPMMVVNPAVNPVATPRTRATTPNRRSLTVTSPAIAVIDRLLSMSANNSGLCHNASSSESTENSEANQAMTQLRELLTDKEIDVHNLRTESKDLRDRICGMESQFKNLETISQDRLKKINELNKKLDEKTKMNKSMAKVVEEYERTIASLITETQQDKKQHAEERVQLITEREEATSHLASMEISFSDLHSKYEKSKQVIFGLKANEDALIKSVKDYEESLVKMQKNYETLKQHATAKLNHANEELDKLNKSHEAEVLKLNAMLKRKEVDITSLEESLAQKTKTNEELASICDSLLAKFS